MLRFIDEILLELARLVLIRGRIELFALGNLLLLLTGFVSRLAAAVDGIDERLGILLGADISKNEYVNVIQIRNIFLNIIR